MQKQSDAILIDEEILYHQPYRIGAVDGLNRTLITHFKSLYYTMYATTEQVDMMSQQSLRLCSIYLTELYTYLSNQGTVDVACTALFSSNAFNIVQEKLLLQN